MKIVRFFDALTLANEIFKLKNFHIFVIFLQKPNNLHFNSENMKNSIVLPESTDQVDKWHF